MNCHLEIKYTVLSHGQVQVVQQLRLLPEPEQDRSVTDGPGTAQVAHTPVGQICCFFGGRRIHQQRHVGDPPSLEALHDALVPPGAVAEVIPRHNQHQSGLGHRCSSL